MLILGLLLTAAALIVFGYMLFGTQDLDPLRIDLGVFAVELTPMHLYLLGAATLVVLVLGLFVLTLGLRAQRRRRREVKELRAAVRDGDTGRRSTREDPPRQHPADHPERPVEDQRQPAPGSYERDVPAGSAGQAPPPPPQEGTHDVALPSDYPRDGTTPGGDRP
ncbi:hypothetical protein [Ornithinimicrobium murale]|uniref:hypothetical protein n=1 Tax=Ornithinimicrobium murale TaxID=1050153 RepID=UPI0013B46B65|nr:hypothetical protein [Ornithinimicrobium murale]